MARVLAYTSPARGHLYPLVPILDALARRGDQIAIRTLASQVTLMQDRGFTAAPIAAHVEGLVHDDYKARTPPGGLRRAVAQFAARAEYEVVDLRGAIDAEQPDVILVDAMSWGASAAAAAWGGPWAQWFPYPLPVPSPDVPPFGPGLRPASGPLGRLRDRALRPLMLSSDWPASVRMVGPCCWDPPADPPAWLAEIRQPIVLVSTSSEFQDDGRLVTTALEALANEDVHVIATMPANEIPRTTLPANAHVEQFLPHTPILARAACAVTHGGAGVTQKALAARVPVCVVPFGRDQLEVARRVEVADAGTRLPARRLNPERLRAKVREAMTKHDGTDRVAAGFAATGGPTAAAHAVQELLAAHTGSRQAGPSTATELASR